MNEIVFCNCGSVYSSIISNKSTGFKSDIILDTGSPITIAPFSSLPNLTGKPVHHLIAKTREYINKYGGLLIKRYNDNDENDVSEVDDKNSDRRNIIIVPYCIKDVCIGNVLLPYLLVWVNTTDYEKGGLNSTILFGMDYIGIGKKRFDNKDSFCINLDDVLKFNTFGLERVLSNITDEICNINNLLSMGKRIKSINCFI